MITELVAYILILLSALLSMAAGIGIVRLPDVLSRLHAGTKPQILGLAAILLAIVVFNPSIKVAAMAFVIMAFQVLAQPLTAHMIGRAGYRTRHLETTPLAIDEFAPVLDAKDDATDDAASESRDDD